MLTRICMSLALLIAIPAWSQVEPSATGPPVSLDEMRTPPPVSGEAYPTVTGSETRSNVLRAGLSLNTAYDDNVFPGSGVKLVGDVTYSLASTFALDQTTPRTHRTVTYSPGFTIYQHTSALNGLNQNAAMLFQYHLSPHTTINLRDSFVQSSNVFDQPYVGVSGSTQLPTVAAVAPFANQFNNATSGELSYQFGSNDMIGGSGTSTFLNYSNPAQASGLSSNSSSYGGSAFYNRRLSSTQYIGMTYLYSRMSESLANTQSETHVHTLYSFYSLYLRKTLSLSLSSGPQRYAVAQFPLPAFASWTPAVTASMGWQTSRTNFAASYSRTVNGAGGPFGAFQSNTATGNASWQLARNWTAGLAVSYVTQKNVVPAFGSFSPSPGGYAVSGTVSVQHPMGERLVAGFGYSRIHQSYAGISVITENPDSDRVYISISYQFAKPLGR